MESEDSVIRLLMVDDEREFLEATAAALTRRGFAVRTAAAGAEALRWLEQEFFDVALIDVKMPGIDGVELFRRLQAQAPALPVVMLTGHGTVAQAFQSSKDGVADYLTKPCSIEQLVVTLRAVYARVAARSAPREEEVTEIRLLLLDDEEDFVASLTPALERRGINVTAASRGAEALELVDRQIFDVALIDVNMPGVNGLEFLRQLKRAQPMVEVIVLTGYPSMGRAVEAVRDGAYDFLRKPQRVEVLVGKIRDAAEVRRRRSAEEAQEALRRTLEEQPD